MGWDGMGWDGILLKLKIINGYGYCNTVYKYSMIAYYYSVSNAKLFSKVNHSQSKYAEMNQ